MVAVYGTADRQRVFCRPQQHRASDRTKYGTSRCSARSYVVHHTQRISLAAAMYDAMAVRKRLLGKKQKIAAPAAPTDDARA